MGLAQIPSASQIFVNQCIIFLNHLSTIHEQTSNPSSPIADRSLVLLPNPQAALKKPSHIDDSIFWWKYKTVEDRSKYYALARPPFQPSLPIITCKAPIQSNLSNSASPLSPHSTSCYGICPEHLTNSYRSAPLLAYSSFVCLNSLFRCLDF